jgi:hypothetical protein
MYKKKSLEVTTTVSTVETMNSAANTVGDTSIVFLLLHFPYSLYFFEIPQIFPLSQSVKISDNPRIVDFHCVSKGGERPAIGRDFFFEDLGETHDFSSCGRKEEYPEVRVDGLNLLVDSSPYSSTAKS